MKKLDIVGITEVATITDMPLGTIKTWSQRGHLPEPDSQLACGPIWRRSTIERWTKSDEGKKRLAPASRRIGPRAA
jgi:hypothetical protein